MRKALLILSLLSVNSPVFAQKVSNEQLLQKVQQLEQRVNKLEVENKELKKIVLRKGKPVLTSRKKTKTLNVGGRVLFRFSQFQNSGKSIFGDKGNGFSVRKAHLRFSGKLNDNLRYFIQFRSDRGNKVQLWDAYMKYNLGKVSLKAGQFKVPVSMSYLEPGVKLPLPERPMAVNKIAPVWRDVGISGTYSFAKGYKVIASIMNGEGYNFKGGSMPSNSDKKYIYSVALDTVPIDNSNLSWRLWLSYETGYDRCSKMSYETYYGASSVKRNLIDAETKLNLRGIGLSLEGGYLHDNPSNAKNSKGKINLGNAKGYYLQGDYDASPIIRNLHIVGRYSYLDPNTDKDDSHDSDYKTIGFYYLINGWQAALRTSYTWAGERHGKSIDNNEFITELQLLF